MLSRRRGRRPARWPRAAAAGPPRMAWPRASAGRAHQFHHCPGSAGGTRQGACRGRLPGVGGKRGRVPRALPRRNGRGGVTSFSRPQRRRPSMRRCPRKSGSGAGDAGGWHVDTVPAVVAGVRTGICAAHAAARDSAPVADDAAAGDNAAGGVPTCRYTTLADSVATRTPPRGMPRTSSSVTNDAIACRARL